MKRAILLLVLISSCFANAAYGVVVYNRYETRCDYGEGSLQTCLEKANNQVVASVPVSQLKFTQAIDQSIYGTVGFRSGQYLIVTTQIVNTRLPARPITSIHFSVKTTTVDCGVGPCGSLAQQTTGVISDNVAAIGDHVFQVVASNTNFVPFHSEWRSQWRVEIANTLWYSECDPNIDPQPICG